MQQGELPTGEKKNDADAACKPAGYLRNLTWADSSQVKDHSPGYLEQAPSRGHEASPQSGLGVDCMLAICSSSKKLRGLGLRAQARRISIKQKHISHILCFGGFIVPIYPA